MITINMEMAGVRSCTEHECAYNANRACHARAITIGDGTVSNCDTYFKSNIHSRNIDDMAGVGACKVSSCGHNEDFECQADQIEIETTVAGAKCITCTV